jgi:hypothetical protein
MTTLDRSSFSLIVAAVDPPRRRYVFRSSIFGCAPKYRILRMIVSAVRLHALHNGRSRALMQACRQDTRTHSSWSRV